MDIAEKRIRVSFSKTIDGPEFAMLESHGVVRIFFSPFMSDWIAVLSRIGKQARWSVEIDTCGSYEILAFDLL